MLDHLHNILKRSRCQSRLAKSNANCLRTVRRDCRHLITRLDGIIANGLRHAHDLSRVAAVGECEVLSGGCAGNGSATKSVVWIHPHGGTWEANLCRSQGCLKANMMSLPANALLRHAARYKDQNQIPMSEHGFLACIVPGKELDTKQLLY